MQDEKSDAKYREILDELQVQSWQLELVISGFAIFGLFSALEPLQDLAMLKRFESQPLQSLFISTIYITCILAIFNLILHVLLRGLWIGAVGIRSVSGDIDFNQLNIAKVFKTHLKKRIGSFDKYIINLENYSSILFGVTFLIAFITIAVSLNFLIFLFFTLFLVENDFLPFELKAVLGFVLFPAFFLGHLITIIDFVIPGIVKRSPDVAKVYLPVYKIFSVLTLSFIYRPILYNLLDNKFGKKIIYSLIPIYGILLFFFSLEMNPSNFFDSSDPSSEKIGHRRNYSDLIVSEKEPLLMAGIQSKTITDPFLQVTIPYRKFLEDDIIKYDSLLKPESDERIYKSTFSFVQFEKTEDSTKITPEAYLKTINEMFQFQLDSKVIESDLIIVTNENKRLDLEMYVDLLGYRRGKHILTIKNKEFNTDSVYHKDWVAIPFWYFPENPSAVLHTSSTTKMKEIDSVVH
ncbi:hypothetical protein ACFQZJ_11325 [Maribacter chungangensis]|uniref:DUF2868 domain-containing protein n=1 Tax=Maribacter chungangensis TaxID=1069117 RepID=A0ABW3B4R8_9FLAO